MNDVEDKPKGVVLQYMRTNVYSSLNEQSKDFM